MTQAEKEEEGEKKVTVMILEVDLKCYCCYKKVKKLLCKFPQIRGQVFDEDKNKVTITVVCCNPEKLRDELCCKGGKAIQTIEILERNLKPPSPRRTSSSPTKDHTDEKVEEKPTQEKPPPPPDACNREKLKEKSEKTKRPSVPACCQECSEGRGGGPCHYGHGIHGPPPVSLCCQECSEGRGGGPCHYGYGRNGPSPVSACCQECYEGRGGGPCHYGYGRRVAPPPGPCFDTYRYPYTGNRPSCVTICDDYFSEENPQGCSIM